MAAHVQLRTTIKGAASLTQCIYLFRPEVRREPRNELGSPNPGKAPGVVPSSRHNPLGLWNLICTNFKGWIITLVLRLNINLCLFGLLNETIWVSTVVCLFFIMREGRLKEKNTLELRLKLIKRRCIHENCSGSSVRKDRDLTTMFGSRVLHCLVELKRTSKDGL